jgi:hypothetical protein
LPVTFKGEYIMAFGQKKEAPKTPTFYLKPSTKMAGGYYGKIGDEQAELSTTATGEAVLTCGGVQYKGKAKEGTYGPYHLFVIDGHFWFGNATKPHPEWGVKYKLKQGNKAEDSADWKAKQAAAGGNAQAEGRAAAAALQPTTDGGVGPAGLAAPEGMSAGVQVKSVTPEIIGNPTPRPPKPAGYKRPTT